MTINIRPPAVALSCLAGAAVSFGSAAHAQSALVPPAEVAIVVSTALKSRDFIDPLVCALQRVLVAPISTSNTDMGFTRDMLATASQLDVSKVADRFIRTTAKEGSTATFKYLLLPYDLKAPSLNYVFATTFGDHTTPYQVSVISTARLDTGNPMQEHHTGANITAFRVYKLMLKSVARLSGLVGPDRCVLAFPRGLEELDLKSPDFCPEDQDTLVNGGVLKAKPSDSGDCLLVSDATPHGPRLTRAPPRPLLARTD